MKSFSRFTGAAGVGLICLLSACASTPSTATADDGNKKAATNCEVTEARIGSNMSHRNCAPAAYVPPQAAAPAPSSAQ